MHTVASPPVTYLLLTIGLSLLIFEFFTAGVGRGRGGRRRAAWCWPATGWGRCPSTGGPWPRCCWRSSVWPSTCRPGCPGPGPASAWSLYAVSSLFLFRDGLRPSWITLLAGIGGVALAFIVGMPSMVRARFATPTIGREWMIGEMGEAEVAIDPLGVAVVRGAQWRARTNRATPLGGATRLRVVAIDGYTLEVEPEVGRRKDHRERRGAGRSGR